MQTKTQNVQINEVFVSDVVAVWPEGHKKPVLAKVKEITKKSSFVQMQVQLLSAARTVFNLKVSNAQTVTIVN